MLIRHRSGSGPPPGPHRSGSGPAPFPTRWRQANSDRTGGAPG